VEIVDYLRIARSRLWVFVGVPLLAGLIAAAVVLGARQMFTASVVIAAPALIGGTTGNQYNSTHGVTQFVAAFQAAATSPHVLNTVSAKTDVPASQIVDNLTVTQVGTSSEMDVTYLTATQEVAKTVAFAVAGETLHFLFSSQVELAKKRIEDAQAAVASAEKNLQDFYQQNDQVLTEQMYQQQIVSLEQQALELGITGNFTGAAAINTKLAELRSQRDTLTPLFIRYRSLSARLDHAHAREQAMEEALQHAKMQQDAANPASVVTVSNIDRVERVSELVKKVAPAIGAGLFLAVGLVVVLELLTGRRSSPDVEQRQSSLIAHARRRVRYLRAHLGRRGRVPARIADTTGENLEALRRGAEPPVANAETHVDNEARSDDGELARDSGRHPLTPNATP
jgi:capsular polysaccharide biosynthesis protein